MHRSTGVTYFMVWLATLCQYRDMSQVGSTSTRWAIALATIGLLAVLGIACQPQSDASELPLRRAIPADPQTLDPHRAEGTASATVLMDLYEGLVKEDPSGKVVAGAAERWTISEDGLMYTFYLRDNLRWSNGDALVAEDFAAGLRRTIDPQTASAYAPLLRPIRNAESVAAGERPVKDAAIEAIDARTLRVGLEQPTPFFLGLLTHWATFPLHRPSFEAHGTAFVRPEHSITNGAYTLRAQRVGDRISLDKNANYWNAANVSIEQVEFLPLEDASTELRLFEAGELDITSSTPANQFQTLQATYGDQLHVTPNLSVYFMVFDLSEPPFSDIRVREALTIALDREALTKSVLASGQAGAWGLVPPGIANHDSFSYAWREWPREKQLEYARAQLADAGYDAASTLEATLLYNTGDTHQKIAIALQGMARDALGIQLDIINQEFKVMLDNRDKRDQWDLMRLGWTGDYNDADTFLSLFRSGHPQNFAGYDNADFDALLDQAAGTVDMSERSILMQTAEKMVMEDYPVLPMYFYVSRHLVSKRVEDFSATPMNRTYSAHLSLAELP